MKRLKQELTELRLLLRAVPGLLLAMFILSVFAMNLLANKSISINSDYLALDCGFDISWFAFLAMDVIASHFGPKAANELSVIAMLANLAVCFVFFLVSKIPGVWGESYVPGSEDIINSALDGTFGGTWYVLAGSSLAFITSALVNNFLNFAIGRAFRRHPDGFGAYAARTYFSTAIGQLTDNLVFALVVSHTFFGWTLTQCFVCALTGMAAELLCEVIFSFFGYRVCAKWKRCDLGRDYFDCRAALSEARA